MKYYKVVPPQKRQSHLSNELRVIARELNNKIVRGCLNRFVYHRYPNIVVEVQTPHGLNIYEVPREWLRKIQTQEDTVKALAFHLTQPEEIAYHEYPLQDV